MGNHKDRGNQADVIIRDTVDRLNKELEVFNGRESYLKSYVIVQVFSGVLKDNARTLYEALGMLEHSKTIITERYYDDEED